MTVSLKHQFTSNVADSPDATLVQPSNWNAEHTLTAGADALLGTVTAGAVVEITCTAAGRAILDDGDAAAQRATLAAAGTGVTNTFTASQIISVTDNTNAALRVTQLGTGNAILVEDSANPDSSPFVVSANGSVGIGTTTPSATLDVVSDGSSGNSPFLSIRNTSGATPGTFGPGIQINNGVSGKHGYLINQSQSSGSQLLISNPSSPFDTYLSVDQSGNVGIGTGSPAYRLDVSATGTSIASALRTDQTEAYLALKDSGTTIGNVRLGSSSNAMLMLAGGSERMRIDSNGRVMVGTTTAGGTGTTFYDGAETWWNRSSDGNSIVFLRSGGVVGTIFNNSTSTAYNTSSDYRLKEDYKPLENPTARLMALNPINFAWKINGSRVDGFLAHEAQEVVPEAVTGEKDAVDEEGKPVYQGIDQSKLVPLLTAALQEALKKIDALEARIAALEAP